MLVSCTGLRCILGLILVLQEQALCMREQVTLSAELLEGVFYPFLEERRQSYSNSDSFQMLEPLG